MMINVRMGFLSKAIILVTFAIWLIAGSVAHADTYELRLERLQLFGECSQFEPLQLQFSPRPPSTNDAGVGYDTRAGGPDALGVLVLESEDYWRIISIGLTVGYEGGDTIFSGFLSVQDYQEQGAWYDMHNWDRDDRVYLSFLRHDPPGIDTDRAMIFVMPLSDACVMQLDWRYP